MFQTMFGTLYLIATPIGNLQDISLRALEILRAVDLVACEDTRHTLKLLNHFSIKNRLISYHEHNETERADELAEVLRQGRSIAVVSDAGTPGICDPSFRLVEKVRAIGIRVVPVPGAAAFVSAVIASGLPTDTLFFGGFLPSKKNERLKRLEEVKEINATLVFYETPHRLTKSLADCIEILGNRRASIARELTKLHEEITGGNLTELAAEFSAKSVKGEIVLVIDRHSANKSPLTAHQSLPERIAELETQGLDRKTALKKAAKEFGLSKSEAYRQMQTFKLL